MIAMGRCTMSSSRNSQKRQIRMKSAINLRRIGAAFGLKSVGLKVPSHLTAQRLLRKGKRAAVPEHTSGELKPHKLHRSPVSEAIRLAHRGHARAFQVGYQPHSIRAYP